MAHTSNEVTQVQRMTAKPVFREEIYNFSLVLGGPTFRFLRKARLSGDHLELLLNIMKRCLPQNERDWPIMARSRTGYVDSFEEKWVLNTPPSEEVLGSDDIQSLADLNNSYEIVRDRRAGRLGLRTSFV